MNYQIKFRHARLAAAVAAVFPLAAYPAEGAGRVAFVSGEVTATATDGLRRNVVKGGEVFAGDTLVTNTGRLQVQMTDGAMVSLSPGSEFRIDAYRFGGRADGNEQGFFSLLKGGLRTITGLIGRADRSKYRVETKVATIGIRGTEFSVAYGNSISVNTGEGVVEVCNPQGCLLLYPGDEGYVASDSTPPQLVQTTEEKENKDNLPPLITSFDSPAEQRNKDGSSAVFPEGSAGGSVLPPLTGTQNYATAYANLDLACCSSTVEGFGFGPGTIDGSGSLDTFSASDGIVGANTANGNSVSKLGNDGVVAWGKWIDNGAGFSGSSSSLTGGEGGVLHYVTGIPTPDSQAALAAMYGASATFSLLGGAVTGSSDGAGSISAASMNVNFSTSTVTSLSVDMSLTSGAINLTASGLAISGFGGSPNFAGSASASGAGCSMGCSSAYVAGGFFGSSASRAGVGFKVDAYTQTVTGAVALKNNATP